MPSLRTFSDLIHRRGYWRRCLHRSHKWGLRCQRGLVYDGYCFKHNRSCFGHYGPGHTPMEINS
jgi:hypothetical protein